jgi:hypothetical protein
MPEKTLNKAALEQYLAGGFKLESIVTQVILNERNHSARHSNPKPLSAHAYLKFSDISSF